MKAIWNGEVIAESDDVVDLYGVSYFPKSACKMKYFKQTDTSTVCPWKGEAVYYSIDVNGTVSKDGAWCYPKAATDRASHIENMVAFWNGVEVVN